MKNEKWAKGYFANYKGNRVIILPPNLLKMKQTLLKLLTRGLCWIIPSGTGMEKPAKVALKVHQSLVNSGADQSRDVQCIKSWC